MSTTTVVNTVDTPSPVVYKLVLIRHGESEWNASNQFTGWTDVDLTTTGVNEAVSAGKLLKDEVGRIRISYPTEKFTM